MPARPSSAAATHAVGRRGLNSAVLDADVHDLATHMQIVCSLCSNSTDSVCCVFVERKQQPFYSPLSGEPVPEETFTHTHLS